MAEDILSNTATTMSANKVTIKYSDEDEMNINTRDGGNFIVTLPKKLASDETRDILIGGIIHEGGHARFSPEASAISACARKNANPDLLVEIVNTCIDAELMHGTKLKHVDFQQLFRAGYFFTAEPDKSSKENDERAIKQNEAYGVKTYEYNVEKTLRYYARYDEKYHGKLPMFEPAQIMLLVNMFEDLKVEKLMAEHFGNAKYFLDKLNAHCVLHSWNNLKPEVYGEPSLRCDLSYALARALQVEPNLDTSKIPAHIIEVAERINEFEKTCTEGNELENLRRFIMCLKDPRSKDKTEKEEQEAKRKIEETIKQLQQEIKDNETQRNELLKKQDKIRKAWAETYKKEVDEGAQYALRPGTKGLKIRKQNLEYHQKKAQETNDPADIKKAQDFAKQFEREKQLGKEVAKANEQLKDEAKNYANKIEESQQISREISKLENELKNKAAKPGTAPCNFIANTGIQALQDKNFKGEFVDKEPERPKNFETVLEEFFKRKDLLNEQNESGLLNRKRITEIATDTCPEDDRFTQEELRPTRTDILICVDTSSSMNSVVTCSSKKRSNKHQIASLITHELLKACEKATLNHNDVTTKLFKFNRNTTEVKKLPKTLDEVCHILDPEGGTYLTPALKELQKEISNEKETIIIFVTDLEIRNQDIKTVANELAGTMTKTVFMPLTEGERRLDYGIDTEAKRLGIQQSDDIKNIDTALVIAAKILERGIE